MTKPGQARSQTPAPQAQATKPRRIGLYGGAFDPPHLAHVALAQAAVQQLGLERIYIIPTGQPWMKQRQLTPPAHRLHMAQAAFASIPQAVVDDCELRRSGTTYTIDTLRELQRRYATAAATDAPASATTHAITPAAPAPANHPHQPQIAHTKRNKQTTCQKKRRHANTTATLATQHHQLQRNPPRTATTYQTNDARQASLAANTCPTRRSAVY